MATCTWCGVDNPKSNKEEINHTQCAIAALQACGKTVSVVSEDGTREVLPVNKVQ